MKARTMLQRIPACRGSLCRLLQPSTSLASQYRHVSNVGSPSFPAAASADVMTPSSSFVPEFGSQKKRAKRVETQALHNKTVIEETKRRLNAPPSQDAEDDAEVACRNRFSFMEKPLHLSYWWQFLNELTRFEFRWSLSPGIGGVYHLEIIEFNTGDRSEQLVCHLLGDGNQCAPIADFFEGIAGIIQGTFLSFSVPFLSRSASKKHLIIEAMPRISASPSAVEREQYEQQSRIGGTPPQKSQLFTQTCKTGYVMNMKLMDQATGIVTPIFHELSLQTVCNLHLASIPPFLRRRDIGIPNSDFLAKEQMVMFRFVWCFIRRECRMTPVEVSELDLLLPPR